MQILEYIKEVPFKEIMVVFLTALFGYLVWRIQYQKEKIKSIESQLSDKKYKMYSEFVYILFDISKGSKDGQPVENTEVANRFGNVKRDMFLYAPDTIFKKYTEWRLITLRRTLNL